MIYKELDLAFPGSKFILTKRVDEMKWIKSIKSHSLRTHPKNHERRILYETLYPHNATSNYISRYTSHNEEVERYFYGRDRDFTSLCFEEGDGWDKLCRFLDIEVPEIPFPHENKKGLRIRLPWLITNSLKMAKEKYQQ